MSPRDLERRNRNLVGGDISGGTAQLHQQLVFRPLNGFARAETPIKNLLPRLGVGPSRRRGARRLRCQRRPRRPPAPPDPAHHAKRSSGPATVRRRQPGGPR